MKYKVKNLPKFKADSEDEDETQVSGFSPLFLDYTERSIRLTQLSVPIDESFKEPKYYRKVADRIASLGANDEVRFLINSPGGRLDGLVTLLDSLEQTDANSVAVISGEAHSAASILALNCKQVYVSDYSTMLVHNISFGAIGKGSDVRDQVKHTLDFSERIFRQTYSGFLTEEEILQVLNGKEIWLVGEEIAERLESKIAYLETQEELQALAEQEEKTSLPEIDPKLLDTPTKKTKAKPKA